ncbi:hypothetical protein [Staphylococcus coagulans]|uniref:hypothetical protein n=1 Tax=Staphylococcus coagulans TaxID=74706 RepID=UPI0015F96C2E|nr:hypothetical protein [Staphylococcus coagulans]MBA8772080.1 hypothetical protein [Staphylococcus coagulans]
MEQITLTKEELKEIIAKEVREAIRGKNPISSGSIFSEVKLDEDDITNINEEFDFTKFIKTPFRGRHYKPLALQKYPCGGNEYFNGKVHDDYIHDHIRKLTLAVFGVTKNSDLKEKEFEEAVKIYQQFKGSYLYLYKKRLSKLTIEDFE